MPEFKPFFSGAAGLRIEVEDLGAGGSGSYSAGLAASIKQLAEEVARSIASMKEGAPTEIELIFHLSGSSGGGYTITRDSTLSNFRVRMQWTAEPSTSELLPSRPSP